MARAAESGRKSVASRHRHRQPDGLRQLRARSERMLPQTVSSEQNSGIGLALARGLRNNPPAEVEWLSILRRELKKAP
jgi:hypothetical protein